MSIIEYIFNCKKKIVLYGAGNGGRLIYSILKRVGIRVNYFVDNDPKKTNQIICDDVLCILPSALWEKDDILVINSANWFNYEKVERAIQQDGFFYSVKFASIIDELLDSDTKLLFEIFTIVSECPETDIFFTEDTSSYCDESEEPLTENRIALYTCVIGDYDRAHIPDSLCVSPQT